VKLWVLLLFGFLFFGCTDTSEKYLLSKINEVPIDVNGLLEYYLKTYDANLELPTIGEMGDKALFTDGVVLEWHDPLYLAGEYEAGKFLATDGEGIFWADTNFPAISDQNAILYTNAEGDISTDSPNFLYDDQLHSILMGVGATYGDGGGDVVMGGGANASGGNSISLGNNTNASGYAAMAIGESADASGDLSVAIGQGIAQGAYSIALGDGTASSQNGVVIGYGNTALGTNSQAYGLNQSNSTTNGVQIGSDNTYLLFDTAKNRFSGDVNIPDKIYTHDFNLINLNSAGNVFRIDSNTSNSISSVVVDKNGYLGVGTTTPTFPLDVAASTPNGSIRADWGIRFGNQGAAGAAWLFPFSGGAYSAVNPSGKGLGFWSISNTATDVGIQFTGSTVTVSNSVYTNFGVTRLWYATNSTATYYLLSLRSQNGLKGNYTGTAYGLAITTSPHGTGGSWGGGKYFSLFAEDGNVGMGIRGDQNTVLAIGLSTSPASGKLDVNTNSYRFVIDFNGNVGVKNQTPTYPLHVQNNINGVSIYADANISAGDYIDRTAVFDKSLGKTALSFIKDADDHKDDKGEISHDTFEYSKVSYTHNKVVGYKDKETKVCSPSKDENATEDICEIRLLKEPIYEPVEETGISLSKEAALYRQALYELKKCIADSKDFLTLKDCVR
jgi:hypothetical protein